MARFALLTERGGLLWLARRLAAEGHDVTLHVREATTLALSGLDIQHGSIAPRDATVVFDGTGRGRLGAQLRARGQGVIGGNALDEDLDARLLGATLRMPTTLRYADERAARAYLATHTGEWRAMDDDGRTYSDDAARLARWLRWAKPAPVTLQRVVLGQRLNVVGWFDGQRWVPPYAHVLDADGCVAVEAVNGSPAVSELFTLTGMLRAARYVGPLRLDLVRDREGLTALSATAAIDATMPALSLLWDGDLGLQLERFARGTLKRLDVQTDRTAVTLALCAAPPAWPGMPLDKRVLGNAKTLFVESVRDGKDGPELADGMTIARVGAVGADLDAAVAKALRIHEKLWVPHRDWELCLPAEFPRLDAPLAADTHARDQADAPSAPPPPAPSAAGDW